ncbi:hypothetical protein [Burkholderia sp. 22PA0106]
MDNFIIVRLHQTGPAENESAAGCGVFICATPRLALALLLEVQKDFNQLQ